jgi:hypothetical protein
LNWAALSGNFRKTLFGEPIGTLQILHSQKTGSDTFLHSEDEYFAFFTLSIHFVLLNVLDFTLLSAIFRGTRCGWPRPLARRKIYEATLMPKQQSFNL